VRTWLAACLLAGLAGSGVWGEAPYVLDAGQAGLRFGLGTEAGVAPLLGDVGYQAQTEAGPAFATEGVAAVEAGAGADETLVTYRLVGPLAAGAEVTARLVRRPACVDVDLHVRYSGEPLALNPWTSGVRFVTAAPITGATASPVTKWVRPTGERPEEVPGDTLYRDLDVQVRQVAFAAGTLAFVCPDYDGDWIYGNDPQRATFVRAPLPTQTPAERHIRFSLFALPPGYGDAQELADLAAGRGFSLRLTGPQPPCVVPGGDVEFAVQATNLATTEQTVRLRCQVHDYYGRAVANREVTERLAARAAGGRAVLTVRLTDVPRGILFADVVAESGAERREARTTVAVLPDRPVPAPDPGSSFGMAAMIAAPERYPDQCDPDAVLAAMQRIGVRWVRGGFLPLAEELTPERERQARTAVERLRRYGITPHVQVGISTPLPDDTGPLVERIVAGLERLGALARTIEVGNELNYSLDGPAYVERLLRPLSAAMRERVPDHQIVTMGLGGVHRDWFDPFVAAGGLEPAEVLSVHPGSYPKAPEFYEGWRGWVFRTQMLDACRAAREHGGRQVWITEAYAPTPPGRSGLDLRTSADYLVRTYLCALALGVQVCEWYQFQDGIWFAQIPRPDDVEYSFGIVYTDLTPKPAYLAYGTMTEQLEGYRYVRRLDLGADDLYGVRFARDEGRVDVLWSYREKHETDVAWWPPEQFEKDTRKPGEPWEERWRAPVEVRLPAPGPVQALDIMGNPVAVEHAGDAAVLHLTGSPIYVRGLGEVPLLPQFWADIP